MKYEWKKQEKILYGAKGTPCVLTVPPQNFIMIEGEGDPNGEDFSRRVSALYSLAYAIKMGYKKCGIAKQAEINDFAVYPLEGVWDKTADGPQLVKQSLQYTIMLCQPSLVTQEMVAAALESVKSKKPSELYAQIRFAAIHEGLCVQMLHTGPYDDEPASFCAMDAFIAQNGLVRTERRHREIYLTNANRVAKEKQKTILRVRVKKEGQDGADAGPR